MNTKKVWFFAILFGLISAGTLYVMLSGSPTQLAKQASTISPEEEEKESIAVVAIDDEKKGNEIIPVSKGNRAMTIAITDVQGVAGFINPGTFVDVVAVLTLPENQKGKQHDAATILLQNVKVLALGHASDDEDTMKRYEMATIEVSPEEGLALGFATRYELHLMLRGDGDNKLEPDHRHIHEDDLHEGVFK